MGQALPGHGPASGPASGARKRSGHTLERTRPMVELRNAGEQLPAEMLASGQFRGRARARPHCGVRRSPLVHWRLLTRLLDSPLVVWSWFCDIKIPIPTLTLQLHLERSKLLRKVSSGTCARSRSLTPQSGPQVYLRFRLRLQAVLSARCVSLRYFSLCL